MARRVQDQEGRSWTKRQARIAAAAKDDDRMMMVIRMRKRSKKQLERDEADELSEPIEEGRESSGAQAT